MKIRGSLASVFSLALIVISSSCVASQGEHLFLRGLGEFDAKNYTKPERIGLSSAGVALLVGGLVARVYASSIPMPEAVTRNVQTIDIAESLAALGGVMAVCAGFQNGPKSLAVLAPEVAKTAVLKQMMVPNNAERHELLAILTGAIGVASFSDLGKILGNLFLDKENS